MTGRGPAEARYQTFRRIVAWEWMAAVTAGVLWLLRYAIAFGVPFQRPPQWTSWFDQGKYLLSAQAFAKGDLAPASHWYPAAYPLLASPFARLVPNEPFFIPDMILFALACIGFARVVRPLGMSRWVAAAIFTASTLVLDNTALFWLEPWTTTLSGTLIWWLLAAVIGVLFPPERRPAPTGRALALIGALAGALPLVRPSDALVSMCALTFTTILLYRRKKLTVAGPAWIALGGLAIVLPLALLHLAINGPQFGGYIMAGRNQGFAFADLPWRAYVLLITPRPWFPEGRSLVEGLPLLVPGAAGLIVLAAHGREVRVWIALIAAVVIPYAALYLAYTDLQPPGLWRFNNAHYFKWLFPLFGLGLWFWLGSFGRVRTAVVAAAALVAMLLPSCFRMLPRSVPDDQPARMLLFRGDPTRSWSEAYFAPAVVADSEGSLVNVGQFHQVPDVYGERAITVTRPFAAHPRRRDPGETPPYQGWQPPYARYGARVSFGLPCWLDPKPCRLYQP
jgi:hypothetical protein